MHYKTKGPNEIQTGRIGNVLLMEPDFTPATQKSAISFFLKEFSLEHSKWLKEHPKVSEFQTTLEPGDARFITAFAWTGNPDTPWITTTQDDLDKLKSGAEIAFVITVLPYKDSGVLHHLRQCIWLQPPARAPGIWHFCEGFPGSD